jgi:hypothetical protein
MDDPLPFYQYDQNIRLHGDHIKWLPVVSLINTTVQKGTIAFENLRLV